MTKFMAKLGVFAALMSISLANYWFTFGLWPLSWTSFALCAIGQIALMGSSLAIDAEGK